MQKLSFEQFKAIFLLTIFSVIGALFMSTLNFYLIILGIFFILIEIFIEYSYLQKTNTQVKEINKELQKSIKQAQKMLEVMGNLMPTSKMPDVLSNVYSAMENQRSFIYSDIERYCQQRSSHLIKKLENLESRLIKLEKS